MHPIVTSVFVLHNITLATMHKLCRHIKDAQNVSHCEIPTYSLTHSPIHHQHPDNRMSNLMSNICQKICRQENDRNNTRVTSTSHPPACLHPLFDCT